MIKLYNGDCYEVIKDIPDKTIDLVYIDIPYLIKGMIKKDGTIRELTGFTKEDHNSNKFKNRNKTYVEIGSLSNGIDYLILDELCRVMKNIYIYIWCSKEQILDIMKYFVDNKRCMFEILVWCKTNPTPLCNNTWLPDIEYCLLFRERGTKLNNGYKLKSKFYVSSTNIKDKKFYKHPTIKPLDLVKRHIEHSTQEGDFVLDCFMGSGTTGVACKELNRNFIGIELNEDYFNIAKERIEESKGE